MRVTRFLSDRFAKLCLMPLLLTGVLPVVGGELRTWTDFRGNTVQAEYLEALDDCVTLRLPNLQNLTVSLKDLSPTDQTYVKEQQARELEEKLFSPYITGEVVWRLPLSSNPSASKAPHNAEIWTWDEEQQRTAEKIADVQITYDLVTGTRDQYEGTFRTAEPVTIFKDSRLVLKVKFLVTVEGETKILQDASKPIQLPSLSDNNELKLPTVRAMAQ